MSEQKPKIIAVVGLPGSGKGTCTDYLTQKYGWPLVHFGHMVYEEVERRGLDIVKYEKEVRMDMRAKEGNEVLAKRAAARAVELAKKGAKVVIFDGLYSWTEFKYLDAQFGTDMLMIAVNAPRKLRHERTLARKDAHRQYTLEDLISREYAEIEQMEKGGPIAYADYTILNNDTVAHMEQQLDAVLKAEHLI